MSLHKYFKDLSLFLEDNTTYQIPSVEPYLFDIRKKLAGNIKKTTLKELRDWETEVYIAVDDKLPNKYKGKKRPQNRLFPYKVSEDLQNNISTSQNVNVTHFGVSTKFTFNLESPHSTLTTYGFTSKGKYTSKGNWVGWTDKVFKQDKYGKVTGAKKRVFNVIENEIKNIDKYIF